MSNQFLTRFTEGQKIQDPFDYLSWEINDEKEKELFKDMGNHEVNRDYIFRGPNGVEVRRKKSNNPLLEGKSIIYEGAFDFLESSLARI